MKRFTRLSKARPTRDERKGLKRIADDVRAVRTKATARPTRA